MKKIGLLCMALVLALGALGVSYAMWYDDLYISGNVTTGFVDVDFNSQYDNDAGATQADPKEIGRWDFAQVPPVWVGNRYTKHVATTSSTFDDGIGGTPSLDLDTATITIANGYPSYYGSVCWDIINRGQIPVTLYSVNLTQLSKEGTPTAWVGPQTLLIGTRYYVDVDDTSTPVDQSLDAGDDFSFVLSAHDTVQLDPYTWTDAEAVTVAYLDITVHVEQDSEQKTLYDFKIAYRFAQWNEGD